MQEAFYKGLCLGISATIIVAVFLVIISACAEPPRQFNSDDEQDLSCYGKFGGQRGYCDKGITRK